MAAKKRNVHRPTARKTVNCKAGLTASGEPAVPEDQFHEMMMASLPIVVGGKVGGALAVAVSGGADSMALCLLVADWARKQGRALTALTVDHGLRPAAIDEARQVKDWLQARNINHETLVVTADAPKSNLQAWARDARYSLMEEWCADQGVNVLLLAHHLEDQAETLLLRLGRGSGVDGLSAMAPNLLPAFRDGPWRVRPLLDLPKASLVKTLQERGQTWIEDPTNQDQKYTRNRLRGMANDLADIGLTPQRLAATAKTMRRAKAALDAIVAQVLDQAARVEDTGYCQLDLGAFAKAPGDVQLRLLGRLLMALGGQQYAPRLEKLTQLNDALINNKLAGGRTLSGCRIVPNIKTPGQVLICRESRSVAAAQRLPVNKSVTWDRRYRLRVSNQGVGDDLCLARLGSVGWSMIRQSDDKNLVVELPRLAGLNLPALWREEQLLSVPSLDYMAKGAELTVDIEFTALRRIHLVDPQGHANAH